MEATEIYTRSKPASSASVQTRAATLSDDGRGAILVWIYIAMVILPIGFSIGTLAMTGMRLLLLFTILPTAIGLFTGRFGKVYPIDYLLALHVLWAVLSIGISNPSRVVENAGAYGLEFFGAYVLGRTPIFAPPMHSTG